MRLHRELVGSGPTVLLVHAGGTDGRMWQPLAQRLSDRFRFVIPDLRGNGRTPMPAEPYADAEDLVALLDELEIERAPVAGASFGGWVALQLATLAPERVSALALFAATLADSEQWSPEIEAYWAKEEELLQAGDIDGAVELGVRTWVRDPATAQLVADMSRAGFEAQLGVEAPERELGVELHAIAVPTLAVDGGLDLPDWAPMADRIAAAIPGAQRATVADAGHLIALERPDAAAELLAGFLERVGA